MKIVNIMLGRGLGGIEQAFLDYSEALRSGGHEVLEVVSRNAQVKPKSPVEIANRGQWDIFSMLKLRSIIQEYDADAVITHGGRAACYARVARMGLSVPIVSLVHNYSNKRLVASDYLITVTKDLADYMANNRGNEQRIYHIPNMLSLENLKGEYKLDKEKTIVIGNIGRLHKNKGWDVLLHSLSLLKTQGYSIHCKIAGDGPEKDSLISLVQELGLGDAVTFMGWVQEKKKFFNNIDIFILSSRIEPFGIVLLEAMHFTKPIISTDCTGPAEVLEDRYNALICKKDDVEGLAERIEHLIKDQKLAAKLAENGYKTVKEKYDIKKVSDIINSTIENIVKNHET